MQLTETLTKIMGTGLVQDPAEIIVITDEPKIPGYLGFASEGAKKEYVTEGIFGQGYHPRRELAKIKAVAECLERLCLENPLLTKSTVQSSFKPKNNYVDPGLFCSYSNEQVDSQERWKALARQEKFTWFPVEDIFAERTVLVPAQMVYISNDFGDEFPLRGERISTGAAFGKKAIPNGLLEVIERDACITAYLTKRPLERITNLPGQVTELVAYLERYQLETYLFNATNDLNVPTVLSLVLDKTGIGPAINIGSRSAFSVEEALQGALLESIHCRRTARFTKQQEYPNNLPAEDEITSMDKRFYYWYALDRIPDLDFWLTTPNTVPYDLLTQKNTTLEETLDTLRRKDCNVFVADITLPEIAQQGFQTVKVIVPELHPLYLDERAKALYSVHHGNIQNDPTLKPHPLT